MRKYLEIAILGLIIVIGGVIWFQRAPTSLGGAVGPFNSVRQYLTSTGTTPITATTSINLVYLTAATSTYVFDVDNVNQVNLNLFTKASSTTDNLYWYYAFAQATSTASDTWFREDAASASGALTTHNASQMTHIWNPLETATSSKNVLISNINSKYMKIGFWAGTTTVSTISFWAEAILQKGY